MEMMSNSEFKDENTNEYIPGENWYAIMDLVDPKIKSLISDLNLLFLDEGEAYYFIHNLQDKKWLNHVFLLAIIYKQTGKIGLITRVSGVNTFLNKIIPAQYKSINEINVEEAMFSILGRNGRSNMHFLKIFNSLQAHRDVFFQKLGEKYQEEFSEFFLPRLAVSPRIRKKKDILLEREKERVKRNTEPLVKNLPMIMNMVDRRFNWIYKLYQRQMELIAMYENGEIELPFEFEFTNEHNTEIVSFQLWNWPNFILKNRDLYQRTTKDSAKKKYKKNLFFLECTNFENDTWFLQPLSKGVFIKSSETNKISNDYIKKMNVINAGLQSAFSLGVKSVFNSQSVNKAMYKMITQREIKTAIFDIRLLLLITIIGKYVIEFIINTGSRINEVQQVILDKEHFFTGYLGKFNDQTKRWEKGPQHCTAMIYPKGHESQKAIILPKPVILSMEQMIKIFRMLDENYELIPVKPEPKFQKKRHYPDKYKFVLQWSGKHIDQMVFGGCIDFLLLGHGLRDDKGNIVRITPHKLRHAIAGRLYQEGVPLEYIMELLNQVNSEVTKYYAKISREKLFEKIGPFLQKITKSLVIDHDAIRDVADIAKLQTDALKCFGALRTTLGGECGTYKSCVVQFQCSNCEFFVPEPSRIGEIDIKILGLQKSISLYEELGDYIAADVERMHLRNWECRKKECLELANFNIIDSNEVLQLTEGETAEEKSGIISLLDILPIKNQDEEVEE